MVVQTWHGAADVPHDVYWRGRGLLGCNMDHGRGKRSFTPSWTWTPRDVSVWTNPLSIRCPGCYWRATTAPEGHMWAHRLQSKLIVNCQIQGDVAEIFSRNKSTMLISPPASINASSKKTQLEFVCFSDNLYKNIPSLTALLSHCCSQVPCWFSSGN